MARASLLALVVWALTLTEAAHAGGPKAGAGSNPSSQARGQSIGRSTGPLKQKLAHIADPGSGWKPGWVTRTLGSSEVAPILSTFEKRKSGPFRGPKSIEIVTRPYTMQNQDVAGRNQRSIHWDISIGPTSLGYGRYLAAHSERGTAMLFDIVLEKPYRRAGLYRVLFADGLKQTEAKFGKVSSSPILLAQIGSFPSTNRDVFVEHAFGSDKQMASLTLNTLERFTAAQRVQLRDSLIEAAYQMPAMKVRSEHGFHRIRLIRLNPARKTVIVDIERGPRQPNRNVRIVVNDAPIPEIRVSAGYRFEGKTTPNMHEITAAGAIGPTRDVAMWQVAGYDHPSIPHQGLMP